MKNFDIIIIGGGIAGMTAAIYAARANLSVCIVEKEICGGLVNWTHTVENVPSYKSIHGMALMEACRDHVESLGVEILEVEAVERVELEGPIKGIWTSEDVYISAKALIVATGRNPVSLPIETDFEKIHYCSICDGIMYKGKKVLVVGGGNSGFDESLYLINLGIEALHIIEMFPSCIAAKATQDQALATKRIRVSVGTSIKSLTTLPDGQGRATLFDAARQSEYTEDIDGLFCFIGQQPNTGLFKDLLTLKEGYICTDEGMATNISGIFAVGDVRFKKYRQITTAMHDGTIAAMEAEQYIRSQSSLCGM